jgi:hypothetical protein
MRCLINIAKDVYYGTVGRISSLFWSGGDVYQEQIVDNLNQLGISFSDVNAYLAKNLDGKTRKFPEILKKKRIVRKLAESVRIFYNNRETGNMSQDEKRKNLMQLLAMDIADCYRVGMRLPNSLKE